MPFAMRVCFNCKKRKKKCDKAVPACGQCTLLGEFCSYDDIDRLTVEERLQALQARVERLENLNGSLKPPLDIESYDVPCSTGQKTWLCWDGGYSDSHASALETFKNLVAHGKGRHYICSRFFTTVGQWLPVISPLSMSKLLSCDPVCSNPAVILLLLSMYLLVHDAIPSRERGQVYDSAWSLSSWLVSSGSQLLETLQANLLLALYEHVSGYTDKAHHTMGSCTITIRLMDMDQMIRSEHPTSSTIRSTESLVTVYWCALIWDVSIALADISHEKPLWLTPSAPIENLPLPPNPSYAETKKETVAEIGFARLSTHAFGRDAQAGYLLRHVVELRQQTEIDDTVLFELDAQLQGFLQLLLGEASGKWDSICGATALTISALYLLHRGRCSRLSMDRGQFIEQPCSKSLLALQTLNRIVKEIVFALNEHHQKLDIAKISPTYAFVMYNAGMEYIYQTESTGRTWIDDIKAIRTCFLVFGPVWPLSTRYLETLDNFAKSILGLTFAHAPSSD